MMIQQYQPYRFSAHTRVLFDSDSQLYIDKPRGYMVAGSIDDRLFQPHARQAIRRLIVSELLNIEMLDLMGIAKSRLVSR